MKSVLRTLGTLLFAVSIAASALYAQKGSHRTLVGGTGSSHKGGHYETSGGSSRDYEPPKVERPSSLRLSPGPSVKIATPRALSSELSIRLQRVPEFTAPRPKLYAAPRKSAAAGGVPRDAKGRILRNESAKRAFERQSGHLKGWPGYVVDHVVPLACGGADAPSNMQWQTVEEAKSKDRMERIGCGKGR